MKKRTKKLMILFAAAVFALGTLVVQAEELSDSDETIVAAEDVDLSDFPVLEFEDVTQEMQIQI